MPSATLARRSSSRPRRRSSRPIRSARSANSSSDMNAGVVDTLIILGGNPAYDAPGGPRIRQGCWLRTRSRLRSISASTTMRPPGSATGTSPRPIASSRGATCGPLTGRRRSSSPDRAALQGQVGPRASGRLPGRARSLGPGDRSRLLETAELCRATSSSPGAQPWKPGSSPVPHPSRNRSHRGSRSRLSVTAGRRGPGEPGDRLPARPDGLGRPLRE